MGIILTEQECQTFVNEMYFGKTKDIMELEQMIHNLREKYAVASSQITNYNRFSDISRDKALLEIGNKISEIWGFAECSVNVYFSEYPNAYTYPVTYSMDVEPEKMIVKGANGYKYSKQSNFYTMFYISSAMICNKDYTDGEIMAVLLHEIGHSFSAANLEKCELVKAGRESYIFNMIMNMFYDPSYAVSLVTNTNMYKKVMTMLNNKKKDGKGVYVSSDTLNKFLNNVYKVIFVLPFKLTGISALINKLSASEFGQYIKRVTHNDKAMKNMAHGRTDEYLSDSFAMMYGYGPDQSTALAKMYFSEKDAFNDFCKKVPIVGKLNESSEFSYWVLAETFSQHPSLPARVDNILKELQDELKKSNLSPTMKKKIQDNIKDLEEFKDSVRKMNIDKSDPNKMKKEWLKVMIASSENPDVKNKYENELMNMKSRDEYYNKLKTESAIEDESYLSKLELI